MRKLDKKGKVRKLWISVAFAVMLMLAVAVFANAQEGVNESGSGVDENDNDGDDEIDEEEREEIEQEVEEKIKKLPNKEVAEEVKEYVEDFVEQRGIAAEQITNISEVNFDDLPKEVEIENVGDHNLAIYEVDYDEDLDPATEDEQIFVITYSVEQLRAQGDLIIAHDKRQFLNFGFVGIMNESGFLETATGVETSFEKGYVMVRKGSITAISTNLEIVSGIGEVRIIVYKNGEEIMFGNLIDASSIGVKKDYDVQSKDTVTFEPGDVISVYVNGEGVVWKDVITMVEITTVN